MMKLEPEFQQSKVAGATCPLACFISYFSVLASSFLFSSCAVGPDYKEPKEKLGASFKNAGFTAPAPEGAWWSLFKDSELTRLMKAAEDNGPTALAALARYDQARASLGLARADAFPSITGDAYARRQSDSGNTNFSAGTYNDYRAALNLSWEIDLWGRVRRQIGAARADQEAAAFDYEAARLSLRGEVARAYLSLRFTDVEIALLENTEKIRAEARRLMQIRLDGGASSRIDHDRAVTEHEGVKAELAQARAQRGRYENAVATLVGESASGFRLAPDNRAPVIPGSPAGVPSDLLRRRPDVAVAERRLAAASERIGFTIASFLPRLTLTGIGGVQSLNATELFDPGSQLWKLGPEVTLPQIGFGSVAGNTERARATYREALESYRDTLLRAVRETEDSLGDSHHLAEAAAARHRGAASADSAAQLTRERYLGGATDYFELVDAERTALFEKRAALTIDLARALAATRLIQSLGGGWER
jgi:multidrug efflux system outer membrane protein